MFDNRITIKFGDKIPVNDAILESEIENYESDVKEYGEEIAWKNLILMVTTRLINAKGFNITYNE